MTWDYTAEYFIVIKTLLPTPFSRVTRRHRPTHIINFLVSEPDYYREGAIPHIYVVCVKQFQLQTIDVRLKQRDGAVESEDPSPQTTRPIPT